MNEPARIPFRMHPRVFDALGADLVTSDVVAIIELVKNAYDAFARKVYVKFRKDKDGHIRLDIVDDGHGMTREVIEDVWCLVATPHKDRHPIARRGAEKRRVTGAKGLGRLSAARLGSRLSMLTMAHGEPCWRVRVDWSSVSEGAEIAESYVACERATWSEDSGSGTRLRIRDLHETWDDVRISDLKQNLARLIAPFAERRDFRIFLSVFGSSKLIEVRAPGFPRASEIQNSGTGRQRRKRQQRVQIQTGRGGRTQNQETGSNMATCAGRRAGALPGGRRRLRSILFRDKGMGYRRTGYGRNRRPVPDQPVRGAKGDQRPQGNIGLSGRSAGLAQVRQRPRLARTGSAPGKQGGTATQHKSACRLRFHHRRRQSGNRGHQRP